MSSQASTTQSQTPDGRAPAAGPGTPPQSPQTAASLPAPHLVSRVPGVSTAAGPPPTWGELHTPPQGAGFARPTVPPAPPPEDEDVPLFGGALGAKESPLRLRHLMALCAWAASLTLLGLGVGLWAMIRLMSYATPGWYEPVIVVTGLVGIGLAIASFVTSDKRYLPWALMGASTAVLFAAIGITSAAG